MSPPSRSMTIAMVAGEASGDNLGASLMHELKRQVPDIHFIGMGGPAMLAEGIESVVDMDRLSVNGFVDPVLRLPELIRILFRLTDLIVDSGADCFVGVDSNFFNVLLAGRLRKRGIRTVQYVSPSVWMWRSGRIKRIKRNIDLMMTLFPFENQIYIDHDIPVVFVGHPKAADISPEEGPSGKLKARQDLGVPEDARVLAMLPGSRGSEVATSGRDFLDTARLLSDGVDVFLIPAANEVRLAQITELQNAYPELTESVRVLAGDSRKVMTAADAVLVNGGTATLEAMLLKRPMVMSYRLGVISYAIVSRLIKLDWVSLPNILAGKMLIPELLQDDAEPEQLARAVKRLFDAENNDELITEFDDIHRRLIKDKSEAASAVLKFINNVSN